MLADIESQIKSERKMLSQIDYDVNYRDTPGFLDYHVTDIWWPTKPPPPGPETSPPVTRSSPKVFATTSPVSTTTGRFWTPTIPTTTTSTVATTTTVWSTRTPAPTEPPFRGSFPPGVQASWPFENDPTTTQTPFIQDLEKELQESNTGYFTVGLRRFLIIVAAQNPLIVTSVLDAMEVNFGRLLDGHKLDSFGKPLQDTIVSLLGMMNLLPPDLLQQQANVGQFVLQKRRVLADPKVNKCLDIYDAMFIQEEGQALFGLLEQFAKFPEGNLNVTDLSREILNAFLAPCLRTTGTREHKRFLSSLYEAIESQYPNWRTQKAGEHNETSSAIGHQIDVIMGVPSNNSTGDPLSGLPSRRRMGHDFKKAMHHFLTKHRKLIKRLNKHHKHGKRKKHHHWRHKSHHSSHKKHKKEKKEQHDKDHSRNSRIPFEQHSAHDDHIQHNQFAERLFYEKFKKPLKKSGRESPALRAEEEEKADTSGSEAFFKASNNKKQTNQVSQTLLKPQLLENIDKQYLMKLAQKFKAKLESGNYRRLMVVSSENKSDAAAKRAANNTIVHKIREASSYSDEEYNLKTNLYDALRHGNRSFVHFRNMSNPGSSDEEKIIKRNLYKNLL
ncbi:uncharacterized protein LOC113503003 isoform X2 [Trichoplusia ni]|uniref:Uncharacterized protein LOC113503003 isoform X2 n=1 Tax=Trichoplusia ni TaxID=7111 RepID=A0A7E5WKD0_TRINI|nr:uncharacterized protein LOC113503003 isoform X2 [Trichoplusia ni]